MLGLETKSEVHTSVQVPDPSASSSCHEGETVKQMAAHQTLECFHTGDGHVSLKVSAGEIGNDHVLSVRLFNDFRA